MNAISASEHWSLALSTVHGLQERWGLRISEVLRIRVQDLLARPAIYVRASKGSHDRTIDDAEAWDQLDTLASAQQQGTIIPLSYRQIYHAYRRAGIVDAGPSDARDRVTHAFRARLIQERYDQGESLEQIAAFIGHKDTASTINYLRTDQHP